MNIKKKAGVYMIDLTEKIGERLSVINNLFDDIRIVDPLRKKVIFSRSDYHEEMNHKCYSLWKRNRFCENCISMRAYVNNDSFVKIEYDKDKIILMVSAPIEIDGKIFIAETFKDITKNGSIIRKIDKDSSSIESLISSFNGKVIKDKLTGLYNRSYISERLPVDLKYSRISGLPLSIIMIDFDFAKELSDNQVKSISEKVLIDFSDLIESSIRSSTDWVGRYGEMKFIIVLNDTELKNAYLVIEKIRSKLENATFCYDDINGKITSRFAVYGVTESDINSLEILSELNNSLYKSEAFGCSRTVMNFVKENDVNNTDVSIKDTKLLRLDKQINEMREVLNEICCTVDDDTKSRRLAISQFLDELIVEYMKEVNSLRQNE